MAPDPRHCLNCGEKETDRRRLTDNGVCAHTAGCAHRVAQHEARVARLLDEMDYRDKPVCPGCGRRH